MGRRSRPYVHPPCPRSTQTSSSRLCRMYLYTVMSHLISTDNRVGLRYFSTALWAQQFDELPGLFLGVRFPLPLRLSHRVLCWQLAILCGLHRRPSVIGEISALRLWLRLSNLEHAVRHALCLMPLSSPHSVPHSVTPPLTLSLPLTLYLTLSPCLTP